MAVLQKSVIDQTEQPMTREEAVELFECERLKVSEHGSTKGRQLREFFAGSNDLFILTLGGINPDGSDASNDCTNAILDAAESIVTTEPSIASDGMKKAMWKPKELLTASKKDLDSPPLKMMS